MGSGWGGVAGGLRAGGVAQGRSGLAGDDGAGVPIWLGDSGSQVRRLITIFALFWFKIYKRWGSDLIKVGDATILPRTAALTRRIHSPCPPP